MGGSCCYAVTLTQFFGQGMCFTICDNSVTMTDQTKQEGLDLVSYLRASGRDAWTLAEYVELKSSPLAKQQIKSAMTLMHEFCQQHNYNSPEYNDSQGPDGDWRCMGSHSVPGKWNYTFTCSASKKKDAMHKVAASLYGAITGQKKSVPSSEIVDLDGQDSVLPANAPELTPTPAVVTTPSVPETIDYVSKLYVHCSRNGLDHPFLECDSQTGKIYKIILSCKGYTGEGQSGVSKKKAKQLAAQNLLNTLIDAKIGS